MANTKISDFSELTSPADMDLFLTAQEDVSNKKLTWANLRLTVPWITYYSRPKYGFVSTDTITFGPGAYYLYGKGLVYWTSDITFTLGSGGSNANSDDLTADEWHYIAIDYSTVSAAGALTAANFINRRAANVTPDYSGTKGGVYQDTDDRTIFGVLTNGSSQVLEFWDDGGELVLFADQKTDLSSTDIDTTWTDVPLTIPAYATRAEITVDFSRNSGSAQYAYWRTNGQTGTIGHIVIRGAGANTIGVRNTLSVITDASQIIEVKLSASDNGLLEVHTDGWYFPAGM